VLVLHAHLHRQRQPGRYLGATPVFIDSGVPPGTSTRRWWPRRSATRPARQAAAAVVAVDLYGQCADYDALVRRVRRYGVPLIEDAAEALGASYRGRPAGSFGRWSILSFNGNKIITTSGGGMLLAATPGDIARARHLATQAREPARTTSTPTSATTTAVEPARRGRRAASSAICSRRVRRAPSHPRPLPRASLAGLPGWALHARGARPPQQPRG
jgi:dTDP-4-amino-4,6-dideoxygalactose transaminase